MRKGIVDRFEGKYVVVEFDGKTEDILKSDLPAEIKIGDTLIFKNDTIIIEKEDTASRNEEINHLIDDLFE